MKAFLDTQFVRLGRLAGRTTILIIDPAKHAQNIIEYVAKHNAYNAYCNPIALYMEPYTDGGVALYVSAPIHMLVEDKHSEFLAMLCDYLNKN